MSTRHFFLSSLALWDIPTWRGAGGGGGGGGGGSVGTGATRPHPSNWDVREG